MEVDWEADIRRHLNQMRTHFITPADLDRLERRFWLELWRMPIVDVVEEEGIEARFYGPIQATVAAGLPKMALLNLMLGAGDPGAVGEGHLEEALEWIESLGVDCRIPITPGSTGAAAAEDLLNQRGYRREGCLLRFVRSADPPDFPKPAGLEIEEFREVTEGFSEYLCEGFELDPMAYSFFDPLPEQESWRCYVAIDADEQGIGAAVMRVEDEIAQLGFAAIREPARRMGSHLALLRRRIHDARNAGCHTLFAETEESLEQLDNPSPAARNLLRAGFERMVVRPIWRPPSAPAHGDDEEEPDEADEAPRDPDLE
jgi:GNAT superfamily N-acetyltransferase